MPRLYTIVNCSCSTEWMSLVTYHLRSLLRDDDRRRSTVLGHTRQVHFHSRLARLNPRRIWDARQRCGEKFSSTKHERAVGKLQSVKCKKKIIMAFAGLNLFISANGSFRKRKKELQALFRHLVWTSVLSQRTQKPRRTAKKDAWI